ncbi:MAG: NadR, partial [Pedobacter sp.]|nr:NadR [Pedobacter sp.]
QLVLDALQERTYDLYLLLDIDLPWQEDPLRDFPHMREHFMNIWLKELADLNANYVLINGIEDRLSNAIIAIDTFLATGK